MNWLIAFAVKLAMAMTLAQDVKATGAEGKKLVADFDGVVQERFRDFDEFGMRRVMTTQHRVYELKFTPMTQREVEAVGALESRKADLAIFVAGRGVLGYEGRAPQIKSGLIKEGHGATLSEPVRVTGDYRDRNLPDRAAIRRVAESAFRVGNAEVRSGKWTIFGYAIPASQDACVRCHNGENDKFVPLPTQFPAAPRLAVGDTIGVALYVSRME